MIEKAQKMRTCSICKRDIPEEYFYTKKSYIYKYCIGCARKKSSDNHKKNKKAKEKLKKLRKENYKNIETIKDVYEKRLKPGDRVRIIYKPYTSREKVKYGTVIKLYEYFVLLKLKHHRESFLYQSMRCGDIKIEGEWE